MDLKLTMQILVMDVNEFVQEDLIWLHKTHAGVIFI